jgi:ubiquinone/menaquinone biosynthesis C-methylase UbiE
MTAEGALAPIRDQWAEWLLQRRHGGDPAKRQAVLTKLATVRDRVLHGVELEAGQTLLDVGAGDGLIGFGAVERVGPTGQVVFTDVSADLVNICRSLANQLGVADQCRFLVAGAEDLEPIADDSVDAVTTRAVLIYVRNKPRAFTEFFRVLRPGGRISLYEPINRLMFPEPPGEFFWGYDVGPVGDLAAKLKGAEDCSGAAASTLMDFDERDLFTFAEATGFRDIHLDLHRELTRVRDPIVWEAFLATSPNPTAPTYGELIRRALTEAERTRLEGHLRPLVEAGERTKRLAEAHLWAQKQR